MRRSLVGLAVLGATLAPATSRAETQILVAEVEIDGTGNVVRDSTGKVNYIGGNPQLFTTTALTTTHFTNIIVTSPTTALIPDRDLASGFESLSFSTNIQARPNGNLAGNYGLQVVYRNTDVSNGNINSDGLVTNNADTTAVLFGSGAAADRTAVVLGSTRLFTGSLPADVTTPVANPLGAATDTDTVTIHGFPTPNKINGPDVGLNNVGALPEKYGIEQMIFVVVNGSVLASSTVTGSLSSGVTTNAAAVPVLGLRRVLRSKRTA